MLKTLTLPLVCLTAVLAGCSGIGDSLDRARGVTDVLLGRKAGGELRLMQAADEIAGELQTQAHRSFRAKCHVGLPAMRLYAALGAAETKALDKFCFIRIETGGVTIQREGTEQ